MTTMQIDRAVVEQALEALVWEVGSEPALYAAQTLQAITALRAALAQSGAHQVSPAAFVEIVDGREAIVCVPVYWAQWTTEVKK